MTTSSWEYKSLITATSFAFNIFLYNALAGLSVRVVTRLAIFIYGLTGVRFVGTWPCVLDHPYHFLAPCFNHNAYSVFSMLTYADNIAFKFNEKRSAYQGSAPSIDVNCGFA